MDDRKNVPLEKDPLDELIVNENLLIDKEKLFILLKGHLRLTKSGGVILGESFSNKKQSSQILLYLLARKVIFIKKLRKDFEESVKSKEISETLNIPDSGVRKILSVNLKGIVRREEGTYFIPNYNLYRCEELIREKNEDGKNE